MDIPSSGIEDHMTTSEVSPPADVYDICGHMGMNFVRLAPDSFVPYPAILGAVTEEDIIRETVSRLVSFVRYACMSCLICKCIIKKSPWDPESSGFEQSNNLDYYYCFSLLCLSMREAILVNQELLTELERYQRECFETEIMWERKKREEEEAGKHTKHLKRGSSKRIHRSNSQGAIQKGDLSLKESAKSSPLRVSQMIKMAASRPMHSDSSPTTPIIVSSSGFPPLRPALTSIAEEMSPTPDDFDDSIPFLQPHATASGKGYPFPSPFAGGLDDAMAKRLHEIHNLVMETVRHERTRDRKAGIGGSASGNGSNEEDEDEEN
eukprot:TRINITY_DN1648_c0_g1_i3.p1 TRINITY_DN1648_c0_g1~~TRINITY_DN1648_c0_g1_i3.p1  ORF type:complete len:358 (-),score=78.89 TRINITY_DN1648_c0_g1_i3:883-1848(-)